MRARQCLCVANAALASASKTLSANHWRLICPAFPPRHSSRAGFRYVRPTSATHALPLSTTANEHLSSLQRRALSDLNFIRVFCSDANTAASSAASDSQSVQEIVASGMQLLENKNAGAAIELLERFEHSDDVSALSALGRALLAAAQSFGDLENADDQSELALQLKQSIRKLARANATGKSGGCRSSTSPALPLFFLTLFSFFD
jgi:hypothetical protein